MSRWRILLVAAALSCVAMGCESKAEPMSPFYGCVALCTNECMVDGNCNIAAGMNQEQVDACERSCGKACRKGECKDECKSNCPEPTPEDTVAPPDTTEEDVGGEDDVLAGPQLAGGACEAEEDCAGALECFTKEFLSEMLAGLVEWTYDIPGGMCSKLFCDVSNPTGDQCGEGGFCFDVGPLFDAPMAAGLCLQYCTDSFDCRWPEGYLCYYTGVEGERACLPTDLIIEIPCGDGVCGGEMAPSETAETCPRDCGEEGGS
jgi:hypothetical protein